MDKGVEADTSVFNLSMMHLTNQASDALLDRDSNAASEWLSMDKAMVTI